MSPDPHSVTNSGIDRAPAIGIVVIGRNEGQRLVACLHSVAGKGATIVYVDSGSSDDSVAQAKALGADVVLLATDTPFTAARARNSGFRRLLEVAPDVRFVQFVDGDCVVADGWIAFAAAFLSNNKDAAIACGRRQELRPEDSIYNRLCDFEWNTPVGEAEACGGDFLVRPDAFQSVEGFDDRMIAGEEPELCYRLRRKGWRIHRLDHAMTYHDAAITRFSQWVKRNTRAGYAYAARAALHFSAGDRYCMKENVRIFFWAFVLPAAALLLTFAVSAWFLLAFLAYPAQVARLVLKFDRRYRTQGWKRYCAAVVLCKWPEFGGQVLFATRALRGRKQQIIEYK
jgi:GT2 family glycosyltransferase